MTLPGLPPELGDFLERLERRGLAVTPLEVARLRHLLAVEGTLCPERLQTLLSVLLCKDERQRTLLLREYRRWAADQERVLDPLPAPESAAVGARDRPGAAGTTGAGPLFPEQGVTGGTGGRTFDWRDPRTYPRRPLQVAAAVLVSGIVFLAVLLLWPDPVTIAPANGVTEIPSAPKPGSTGPICPQDLPDQAVPRVWVWVPRPDYRPWLALGAGLSLLLAALGAGWRLLWAERRYLGGQAGGVGEGAPSRGLAPLAVHGDLLLDPAQRREMVWAIDRYVSEDPCRELDPLATVNATARAAGEPRIVRRRLSFPREVWLWCDRKSADQGLQQRLVEEVRGALERANLPARIAWFDGLPLRLRWDDSRAPFDPACTEAAGAQAAVAVIGDGAALLQAWDSPGERPLLERLLRELRVWPRLCLVDLGAERGLSRLAAQWRLTVRGGDGLASWLAGRPAEDGERLSPDPTRLDLWVAAWLLADAPEEHAAAQALRRAMGLRLSPMDYPAFLARLGDCRRDRDVAERLVNRLARAQALDDNGFPEGDGYFTRVLDFWEERYRDSLEALPDDDQESRARLETGLAAQRLWREPEAAAETLLRFGRGRNLNLIRRCLGRVSAPGEERPVRLRPTWDWDGLSRRAQVRLLRLGLPAPSWSLRLAAGHHLVLALLLGGALAGLGWGLLRFSDPEAGAADAFSDPRFKDMDIVIRAEQGGSAWLGSPWALSVLPAPGPFDTPYAWSWDTVDNPVRSGVAAHLFLSGTQAFPIRGCGDGWPRRSLAVVQGDAAEDADARRLAIRLLDRGAADRVLVAPDWRERLDELTQGLELEDDQLLVFLLEQARASTQIPGGIAKDAAVIRGQPAELAAALDFPGERFPAEVWTKAPVRVIAGEPRVSGGPLTWRDAATGLTWVRVCGGTFSMGSLEDEEVKYLDEYAEQWAKFLGIGKDESKAFVEKWMAFERPRHAVLVEDFWITRNELTRAQNSDAPGAASGGASSLPQANIDWGQARTACKRLPVPEDPKDEWEKPDLPTEAQWEYAARAGTVTLWSFGDDRGRLGDFAWFDGSAEGAVHPVGEKRPNGLCLADMHGNVIEWTRDCFQEDAYASRSGAPALDPLVDAEDCASRVVRGGSFLIGPGGVYSALLPFFLRSAFRDFVGHAARYDVLGLRCVRSRVRQP